MQQAKIQLQVRATGSDLHLQVMLDGQPVQKFEPGLEYQKIEIDIDDDKEMQHCLSLVMTGKQRHHTKLDDQGNIIADRVIEIHDARFDNIELGYIFTQSSQYTHDLNGTSETTQQPFYGTMGCNGQVDFRFTTPVYLWLLENM